jgi:HlyD family secretion protein
MRGWTKGLTAAAAVAVLGGGGFAALRVAKGAQKLPVRYETSRAERGGISAKVTATGTLSALVTVQVGSQVSGRIESLRADFGSRVKKGDVIATIDSQLFRAALQQARANRSSALASLVKAKVQAEDAQRQADRSRGLAAQKLVSQADADTADANARAARAQVSLAQAAVEQAVAALQQAEVNLAYTTIVSPIDGVVVSRSIDVGQTVAASFQAPTLFTIAQDLSKMQVDTNVSEADVGRVRPGMKVSFSVDAYPEKRFEGTVRQVRDAAQTVQNVVTYDAVIDVDNPRLEEPRSGIPADRRLEGANPRLEEPRSGIPADRRAEGANPELLLKPGMTANVTFIYADREDVLRIPNSALRFRPDAQAMAVVKAKAGSGGRPGESGGAEGRGAAGKRAGRRPGAIAEAEPGERLVWVVQDNLPVPKSVRVGLTDGTWTELLSGPVEEGESLITEMIVDPSALPQRRPF